MINKYFIAGWLFSSCLSSLYQDALGKDKYMALMNLAWLSGWITVPLAIVGLLVVVILLRD